MSAESNKNGTNKQDSYLVPRKLAIHLLKKNMELFKTLRANTGFCWTRVRWGGSLSSVSLMLRGTPVWANIFPRSIQSDSWQVGLPYVVIVAYVCSLLVGKQQWSLFLYGFNIVVLRILLYIPGEKLVVCQMIAYYSQFYRDKVQLMKRQMPAGELTGFLSIWSWK